MAVYRNSRQEDRHDPGVRRPRRRSPGHRAEGWPVRDHAAQDAGEGRLRRRADRLCRLHQGLEGQQGDDRPLRQVERAAGPDDQGSSRRSRQGRATRQSRQGWRSRAWSTSSTTRSLSTSSAPPRAAVLLASFAVTASAAVPRRTATCSRCRVRSAPRRFPSRVFPGQRMPGHMGHAQITVRNLRIRGIDLEDNLLLVEGAVPGPRDGYVLISKAKAPPRERRGFAGAATKDALKASKKAAPKKK